MTLATTITQKGQITIPQIVRDELGLVPHQKVLFILEQNRIYIKPDKDFLSLGGTLRTKKPFNIKAQTKAAKELVAKNYAQSR